MLNKIIKKIFISNAHQKVLEHLCEYPESSFYDSEIAKRLKDLSIASVNNVLKDLEKAGLIKRERKGKQIFNLLDFEHPIVKRFKVFLNFLNLYEFLEKLKLISDKIIIYGSTVSGNNKEKSDVDILIVSGKPYNEFQKIINHFKLSEKAQLKIKTPAEYIDLKEREPVFYDEVHRGIVYYER